MPAIKLDEKSSESDVFKELYCVKSVQNGIFSDLYFPVFGKMQKKLWILFTQCE